MMNTTELATSSYATETVTPASPVAYQEKPVEPVYKGIIKEKLELKKRIIKNTIDKREAIREIVEGYPQVEQITNLDILSDGLKP